MHRLAVLALACLLLATPTTRAQDSLSLSCAVCHGARNAPSTVPSFYGMSTAQIESALRDFRSGAREGTAMPRLAKAMSDDEIRALAYEFGAPVR
ncbi:cytochrome c553 [Panacagrimonas perspica]|uniref:Cytochrome c553 n=1 Tax=Panacagrimonas perspica TaxID=381431 RepID=A0A4R7P0G7_9GAMM|nr:c-type cytochrome [Panacagrimonas perspica]TDU26752.1 cytochrome c553 [Panacagrimonas perspica]THD04089.1 hypothetical protein B1810_07530 [Panacagrimonas perspica]